MMSNRSPSRAFAGAAAVACGLVVALAMVDADVAGRAESVEIAGLRVSVWRPAPTQQTPAPLVIFSHGFHGASTQSAFLMSALAARGYLVMAPNHRDAMGGGLVRPPDTPFGQPGTWSDATHRDRAEDITSLVEALKADERWSTAIAWSQLALAGHSLGGYTVLGLAGAWPRWKLADVKAVVALSPYAAPFIRNGALGTLSVPVLYQSGTRDLGIRPALRRPGGAFELTAAPAYYVELQRAGHLAWTDAVAQHHASIAYYCTAFLDTYLKGDRTADPGTRRPDVADLRVK